MADKNLKLTRQLMDDNLPENVSIRTVARLLKENNKEVKELRADFNKLFDLLTTMITSLNTVIEQTREGIRIADTSILSIDNLAKSINVKRE